ncbi:MAG TPA: glycosyltransferase family 1 protein [Gaiellaceae bacterium]|nr:glycosyltransferase family 1 protein [Gaiellaceae bacterium]
MHVGLNLIFLVPREMSGLETYARELTSALLREQPDLRLTAFVNREASSDPMWREFVPTVTVPVYGRRRSSWVRGEQVLLPRLAQRAGVDVVHSLASTAPSWGSFRRVVTIHDVIYRIHPEAHAGWRSLAMRALVPLAARRSDRVIVPSMATREDLIRLLKVPAEKIDLVPNGLGASPVARWDSEEELRRRYDLGTRPFVLTVSLKRPNKNLLRLLEAMALIPGERRPILVLAGHATPYEAELRARAVDLGLGEHTRFLGWVPSEELEGLYRSATCFVFPSLYEGFGLPVLEAMARGTPVACSNRGALIEVAGDAALLFDPQQPDAIAAAIEKLLADPIERERLSRAGREQAAGFTWAEAAKRTLETYESAVEYSRSTS